MAAAWVRHFGLFQLRIRRVYMGQLRVEATGSPTGGGRAEEAVG